MNDDDLPETIVPLGWLPKLFDVDARTIRRWITADGVVTFPNPLSEDPKERAVRWGDIPIGQHRIRWKRKDRS